MKDCIIEVATIGEKTFLDLCNEGKEIITIPWNIWDWMFVGSMTIGIGMFLILGVTFLTYQFLKEIK